MIRMLCEQMYSGLDSLVEKLLNEKRQEISDEDKRDNDLLASLIKKLKLGYSEDITDEERDAAERNGYDIGSEYLYTYHGTVDANGIINNRHHTSNPRSRTIYRKEYLRDEDGNYKYDENGKKMYKDIPPNVNLADLGRKRKERADKYRYLGGSPEVYRGHKKNRHWGNLEKDLRNLENARARDDYENLDGILEYRNDALRGIDRAYENEDSERESILQRIAELKSRLSALETERDDSVKRYQDKCKRANKEMDGFFTRKRKEIEDKRQKRSQKSDNIKR